MKRAMSKQKRIVLLTAAVVLAVVAAGLAGYKVHRIRECDQKVIFLSFDDYSIDSWEQYFDLFDQYKVKVTFFVCAWEPSDFCYEAIARGHEIGYHTGGHVKLTDLTREEFYEQAIAPIEIFREKGIELTSFAYPYGEYEDWMNEELLQYYHTLRGAFLYEVRYKSDIPHCFLESYSLDNIHFESDEDFRERIAGILDDFCGKAPRAVTSMYSHAIDPDGAWCISPKRLEILFQEAEKRNIRFCTYKQWQEPY